MLIVAKKKPNVRRRRYIFIELGPVWFAFTINPYLSPRFGMRNIEPLCYKFDKV